VNFPEIFQKIVLPEQKSSPDIPVAEPKINEAWAL
jgi:hypothetical protein